VGVHDRFTPDSWTQLNLTIANIIIYPDFYMRQNGALFNDLSLIQLKVTNK